jgi:anion-transporting  ArsA/GET3 family ATPase
MRGVLKRRFIIVGGKGGVGRTTVAAALATVLARNGRRVLLAHVRTHQRMSVLLDGPQVDERIRQVEPNLWAVNMNPRAALRERGMMVLRYRVVYRAVMENRLVKHFLKAIPSLDEFSMLGKSWYHTTEQDRDGRSRFDTVIFDGPATGHLITMLRIPQVIDDVVPAGPLAEDAGRMLRLLSDPRRTGMWIVTLAEEMPVSEAIDLHRAAVEDLHIRPEVLVVNALYPDVFERDEQLSHGLNRLAEALGDDDQDLSPLLASARTVQARRRINRKYLDQLRKTLPLPSIELPHLFVPTMDRVALDQLAHQIELALELEPGGGDAQKRVP